MSSPLKQNTTTIQELLNTINSLPDAGTDLPELSNEGSAAELFAGKELIDGNGEKVTGTFTIDNELSTQDNLISQIQTALQNKASATGEDVTSETSAYTAKLATLETAITALETELQGKASGGSGGGSVETCTVTIDNQVGGRLQGVAATQCNTGQFNSYCIDGDAGLTTVTIENVVCNSAIFVQTNMAIIPGFSINGTAEIIYSYSSVTIWLFKAPSIAGESCTITLRDDD